MPETISELVKEKIAELSEAIQRPISDDSGQYVQQAVELLEIDKRDIQRIDISLSIPRRENLPKHLIVAFSPFLAESLFREGCLLVDRCLQQRREYNELAAKWFEVCVQIDELIKRNGIIMQEETENYHLPYDTAKSEKEALETERSFAQNLSDKIQKLVNTWDKDKEEGKDNEKSKLIDDWDVDTTKLADDEGWRAHLSS
jgi:hypothetical protein